MRLLLVRHGQSEWNAVRRLQGQADIALSDFGRHQARTLRPVIESIGPTGVIASDLSRAVETVTLLGYPGARLHPGLREHAVGDWTGEEIAAIIAREPDNYTEWRAGAYAPHGGECWTDFRARAVAAVEEARAQVGEGNLLVVCHGGTIRALLEHYLTLSPRQIIPVGPASLSAIRLGATDGAGRLELFNYRPDQLEFAAPD